MLLAKIWAVLVNNLDIWDNKWGIILVNSAIIKILIKPPSTLPPIIPLMCLMEISLNKIKIRQTRSLNSATNRIIQIIKEDQMKTSRIITKIVMGMNLMILIIPMPLINITMINPNKTMITLKITISPKMTNKKNIILSKINMMNKLIKLIPIMNTHKLKVLKIKKVINIRLL